MNNLSLYAEEANITPEEYRYYINSIKEIDATSLEFVEKLCQAAYERGLVTGILDANSSRYNG